MEKKLKINFQRLLTWLHKEREKKYSLLNIVCYRLPRIVLAKLYGKIAAFLNEQFIDRRFNGARFRQFQDLHPHRFTNHFYMIVMPNTLHFLNPCLTMIPDHVNLVLILNGTKSWEEKYLRETYHNYPIFKLITCPRSSLSHGTVLNLLLGNNTSNFGIIDHDLFIFNPAIFDELTFQADECVMGAFKLENQKAGLIFPTTHFMFFNIDLLKKVMIRYKIDARQYKKIPGHLIDKLASLNLGYRNYLKDYLTYFDTFNLILAMAFYEKLSVKILDLAPEDIFHVGSTSYGTDSIYSLYIQVKLLEMPQNSFLRQRYSHLFSYFADSKAVIDNMPDSMSALQFIAQVNQFISKLNQ
jgi:hypothetical protein